MTERKLWDCQEELDYLQDHYSDTVQVKLTKKLAQVRAQALNTDPRQELRTPLAIRQKAMKLGLKKTDAIIRQSGIGIGRAKGYAQPLKQRITTPHPGITIHLIQG